MPCTSYAMPGTDSRVCCYGALVTARLCSGTGAAYGATAQLLYGTSGTDSRVWCYQVNALYDCFDAIAMEHR